MKTTQWMLICGATVAIGVAASVVTGCKDSGHADHAAQNSTSPAQTNAGAVNKSDRAVQYTCSMHPEVVQDTPGTCPKCGMKLVEKR